MNGPGGSAPTNPKAFQRAMIFIDGTNFIHRVFEFDVKSRGIKLKHFDQLLHRISSPRELAGHIFIRLNRNSLSSN
jgi:hypothetical protein